MRSLFRSKTRPRQLTQPTQPIETGIVAWLRSLDDALAAAEATEKPVFALFQEVPGCAGCQQFGADVLSNPVIVDAIENEFVPLLIHNNASGADAEVLAAYGEPAWNFQVVRFLNPGGSDIIERRDRVWKTGPLAARMISALERQGRVVPAYLRLIEQEHSERLNIAYLVQACFWVGEREIGQIDGVVRTEAGFMRRHEVTKVEYDPLVTSLSQLVAQAAERGVAASVFVDAAGQAALTAAGSPVPADSLASYKAAPASDQKRQLGRSYDVAGLSDGQLTKLNAWANARPEIADQFLSPRQRG